MMKFLKTLGLTVIAAAALMVFAGGASATTATSPTGTTLANGSTIKAELKEGEAVLKSSFIGEVKCGKSIIEGTSESQGAGITWKKRVTTFHLSFCPAFVLILKTGTIEFHQTSAYNGVYTSNGMEMTVELSGLHCIFTTSNTNLGTVTGGSPATLTSASAAIPRTGGKSGVFCGSSASFNAVYKVVSPSSLYLDA